MLRKLNLAFNGLSNAGALTVSDALKANTTLVELDISYVPPSMHTPAGTHTHTHIIHTYKLQDSTMLKVHM